MWEGLRQRPLGKQHCVRVCVCVCPGRIEGHVVTTGMGIVHENANFRGSETNSAEKIFFF